MDKILFFKKINKPEKSGTNRTRVKKTRKYGEGFVAGVHERESTAGRLYRNNKGRSGFSLSEHRLAENI